MHFIYRWRRASGGFLVLLFLLLLIAQGSGTRLSANRSAACGLPRIPLLCHSKVLRYAYNELSGHCVSFYHTGCGSSTVKSFLTFEECRRDCMQILRY